MRNKIIVILLGGGVVVGIFYLIFFPVSSSLSPETNAISPSSSSLHAQDVTIVYLNGQQNMKNNELNGSKTLLLKKKVKFATEDNKGKYEIILIDQNRADENITIQNGYEIVKGSIDNSPFILKIPKKSLESGKFKLLVIDKRSNIQKEIDANFLHSLETLDINQRLYLRLNFENLSNYDLSTKKEQKILPVP